MPPLILFAIICVCSAAVYVYSKRYVLKLVAGNRKQLHSTVGYYGITAALWFFIPASLWVIIAAVWGEDWIIRGSSFYYGVLLLLFILVTVIASIVIYNYLSPDFKARNYIEKWVKLLLKISAVISITITVFIIISILFESFEFFRRVSVFEFLFGLKWSPQMALRADQVGSSGSFGAIPVFLGTFLVTLIAMLTAVPLGLLSAIYLSEYASKGLRAWVKPVLEMLAGVPTVVYGYFAVALIAPALRSFGDMVGLSIASESALTSGVVMGIMIIPFILSLSDDVMNAVPNSLREASLGLGATQAETVTKVVIPAALPGIIGAVLLGTSRAIGETMIVVMAAGLSAKLTVNPLESVTTVTVQIVTLLTGDAAADSSKTLAAYALGLTLFIVTLCLNIVALWVVRKYRERYE